MNVYIIGAGASAEDGAPVTRELIDKAFWNFGGKSTSSNINLAGIITDERELSAFKSVFQLYDYFYRTRLEDKMDEMYKTLYHPSGLLEDADDRIEDFFTRIDQLIKGEEDYGLNWDRQKVMQVAKDAGYFFYHTLCLETSLDSNIPKHYFTFIENALKPELKHCIITFNYDMLLEEALVNWKHHFNNSYSNPVFNKNYYTPPRFPWTYGIPFTGVNNSPLYRVEDEGTAFIHYLKLHGSFNWGICPETQEITMYSPIASAWMYQRFYQEKYRCHGGKHIMQPLLIPPTRFKDLDIPGLKIIWEKAKESLQEVTEIHILGYSLPDGDIGAKELFSEIAEHKIKRLVIANPNIAHRNKFKNIIGKNISEIHEYPSFKEYLIGEYGVEL